ncbi:LptE family protein [Thiovibrio frasassiensis]|uniref:LPS assembly lipoprotein LptE n=1 Tax=Thiovibrio frasassiensis TaxID=2984131 RepID=A0A9X4MPE1_9BACT|nr:LptE family protein [Thiovibrio frasassiensis]MDG4476462.1 LPS assembly lipoprotein LptE [Thiovibrio frasassiensis]
MKMFSLKNLSLLLLLLIVAGCGYHNPNMLPPDKQGRIVKLYVPLWANPTNELRLASDIHNGLQDWLGQSKQFTLVNSSGEADYVLNGKINSVSYTGRAYDAKDRALALIATLSTGYTLTDTRTGKSAWQSGFALTETYSLQTDAHKKQALDTLVDKLAEDIYIRLYSAISRYEKNKARLKN